MEIICEIEHFARENYCGSICFIGFDGHMDRHFAIRTVTIREDMAVFHAASGITALSDPQAEYDEKIAKAQRIFDAFDGDNHAAS